VKDREKQEATEIETYDPMARRLFDRGQGSAEPLAFQIARLEATGRLMRERERRYDEAQEGRLEAVRTGDRNANLRRGGW